MLRYLFRVAAGLLLAAAVGCAGAPKHKACCPEPPSLPPGAGVPADPLLPGAAAPAPPAGVAPY